MPTGSLYPPITVPKEDLWGFLFERKEKPFPDDHVILIDPYGKRTYTFAETRQAALNFGIGIRSQWEWQKNDVLLLYTPNCIDTPAIMWGCHWAGGIVSPANPGYTVEELAFQLRDSGAKAIVTQVPWLQNAVKAAKMVGIPDDHIILMGDAKDSSYKYKHFTSIRNMAGTSRYRRVKRNAATDLAFLPYSSGTTGRPKGVMLSHTNVASNCVQGNSLEGGNLNWQHDTIIACLPFFHIYGLTVLIHQAFYAGYPLVVMPKFDLEDFCRLVQDYKVTMAYIVPPIVLQLAKNKVVSKYNLKSLRMINSGAAPLTRELVEEFHGRLGVPAKQGYGLSETSPTTHSQPWDRWQTTIGSVGVLLPNQTAKYMNEKDEEVPVGQTGELWIKGPNVFLGYLNNPEGTKNALTDDGYFKTGDVGYQDKDGNFYITDRVKELIKYSGFQVPPAELEGLLLSHPLIDDVAVTGIYSKERHTELPRAYVVLKAGTEANDKVAKDIMDWEAQRVAGHKKLRGGVRFVKEIPKSVSGKILRRVLKAEAAKEEEQASSGGKNETEKATDVKRNIEDGKSSGKSGQSGTDKETKKAHKVERNIEEGRPVKAKL